MRKTFISACVVHPNIGAHDGAILVKPGFYQYPNNDAARYRAGAATDLDRAALARKQGLPHRARDLLAMCRAVRLALPRA